MHVLASYPIGASPPPSSRILLEVSTAGSMFFLSSESRGADRSASFELSSHFLRIETRSLSSSTASQPIDMSWSKRVVVYLLHESLVL